MSHLRCEIGQRHAWGWGACASSRSMVFLTGRSKRPGSDAHECYKHKITLCKRGNVLFYWHFLLKRIKIQGGATVGLQLWVHKTEFVLVLLFINYCIIFHMNNYKPTFPLPHISDFWISIIRIEFLIKCSHTVTPQKCPLNCTFILLQLKTNRKPWTRGPNTGLSSSLCRHLSCALGQVTANL